MSEASPRERALAFALARGDAAARARARALCGELGAEEALAETPEPVEPAAPEDWLPTLALCGELGAMRHFRVERAGRALATLQAADGGFAPDEDEEVRLPLTGALGGYLARSPFVRPAVLGGLGSFLAGRWAPERVKGGRWETLAGYAHFFANADHEAGDGILQWCGRELERGFRTGVFDAVRTARVLVLCDAHALPGARLEREELLGALAGEQAPDGGFGAGGDEAGRVERTLEALAAWARLA